MNFTEKIINKLAVQPVQSGIGKWDKTNVKGYDIFPNVLIKIPLYGSFAQHINWILHGKK